MCKFSLLAVSNVFFPRPKRSLVATLCGVLVVTSGVSEKAAAQTAHFSGTQVRVSGGGSNIFAVAVDGEGDVFFTAQNGLGSGSMLFANFANSNTEYNVSGFNTPTGLAVDASGDLFILDSGTGKIDEIVATNGSIPPTASPTVVTVATGITSTGDLALDNHGDIFFTSVAASAVEEIVAVNGVIPPSPTIKTIGSGFRFPVGIAVDANENLYVSDTFNNAVKEIVAVNGSIPASPTILTLGSGFLEPEGLVLDKNGNLYVSDYGNNALKEIVAVNGVIPSSPAIVNLGTYSGTQAVTVDSNNILYVGDTGNNSGGTVFKVSLTGGTFAQTNVGSSSQALSMAFTFDAASTLGSVSVLTQGATGLDFVDAGSGSCKANTAYSSGQTCTVNVQFVPRFAGTRIGAVVLTNSTGSVIATGYAQGVGVGPQVSFLPGTETVIPGVSVSNPHGIAVDGKGNIYVSDDNGVEKETFSNGGYTQTTIATGSSAFNLLAVDGAGNLYITDLHQAVLKETPSASGYSQSVVDSGFGYPYGIAVDGGGNIFIADPLNGQVLKETPATGGYIRSTVITGLSNLVAVAVDGVGNLYIAEDGNGSGGALLKETLSAGGYTASALPIEGSVEPYSIIVDGIGNVYFADSQTYNVYKETPTPSGYVESAIVTDLHDILGPYGLAVDGSGKMYIAYLGGNSIVKADFATPPTLNFANTSVGTISPDSPLLVTFANDGNVPLSLEIPATGNNPSINSNFTLDSSNPADCPIISPASPSPGELAPGATCLLSVSYAPLVPGPNVGALTLTDNTLNATGPGYASQSITLNGISGTQTFTVSSEFSTISLNQGSSTTSVVTINPQSGFSATVGLSVSGLPNGVTATFSQNPTRDSSILTLIASNSATPGTTTVTITGTFESEIVTTTIALQVNYVIPFYLSNSPQNLTVLKGFSGTSNITVTDLLGFNGDINFTASGLPVGVTALFSPNSASSASVLTLIASTSAPVGRYQITIAGTATGTLGTEYADVFLTISATPQITWQNPAPITYGTPLTATQLNASTTVPGVFGYAPDTGAILGAGKQPLSAFFTPTDTADYTTASATVYLTVNKATPVVSWPTPVPITYGTALSATQLNATANAPGTFAYSPASGTVLPLGTQTLTVVFTPTDTTDYTIATATVQLTVNKPSPTITWPAPAPITYGTALSVVQLNATPSVPGTFSYSPGPGTVLTAGAHTLTVTFTPTDTTDYTTANSTVQLTVNKATPVVSWVTPAAITYGTALSSTQLNATASVPGTFSCSPGPGTVLTAGAHTLNVTFTPTDTTDYTIATGSVQLTVNKATPVITWPTPAPIVNGTALGSTQLDASANVPGSFAYTPAADTILLAGTNTLRVVFTPNDSADYTTANGSVTLVVNPAPSFTLAASPSSLSIKQGSNATSTISVNALNGFTGSVSLSIAGLPKGVTATFSPNPATKTSTVTVTVSNSASLGNSSLTITGKSGSLVPTTTIALTVVHK